MAGGRPESNNASRGDNIIVIFSVVGMIVVAGLVLSAEWNSSTFQHSTSSSQIVSSETSPSYEDLAVARSRALSFITYLNERNGPGAGGYYSAMVLSSWTGHQEPWIGNYSRDAAIIRLDHFTSQTASFNASYSNLVVAANGPGTIQISYDLSVRETSGVVGNFNASIQVSQAWFNYDGNWLIRMETWNFTSFDGVCPPNCS